MIRGRAGATGERAHRVASRWLIERSPQPRARSPVLAQPKSEMPQSSSRGSREEAGPGRKGREEGASEPGREGGEDAGRRAGALASRALGSPLRRRGSFSLPLTLLLTGPRRTRRTAKPPASCRSAAGRNKSRLQPRGGERPDSRLARSPAPRGAKLRPAAAPGLPSSGVSLPVSPASGIEDSRALGYSQISAHACRSSLLTVRYPTRTRVRRSKHPRHISARTRASTPGPSPPQKNTYRKHVHSLRRGPCLRSLGEETGGFVNCIQQPFQIRSSVWIRAPRVPPESVCECRGETGDLGTGSAAPAQVQGLSEPSSQRSWGPGAGGREGEVRQPVSSPGIALISGCLRSFSTRDLSRQ